MAVDPIWLSALSPVVAMTCEVLVYVAAVHLTRRILPALGIGIVAGLLALGLCLLAGQQPIPAVDAVGWILAAALSFLAFTFCFWAVINLNTTSIRIRVLREIWRAPQRRLSRADLAALYNADTVVDARIQRLVALGHLRISSGKVSLGKASLPRIARAIGLLRAIIIPCRKDYSK